MQLELFISDAPPTVTDVYRLIEHGDNAVYQIILKCDRVVLDIETFDPDPPLKNNIPTPRKGTPLNPIEGAVRLVQVRAGGINYIWDFGKRYERVDGSSTVQFLTELLEDPQRRVIGHNINFDLRFLRWQYGIRSRCLVGDTMLGAKVYFGDFGADKTEKRKTPPVFKGGYGLKNLVERWLKKPVDKTEQQSDWGEPLTKAQLCYAALDVQYTEELYDFFVALYTDPMSLFPGVEKIQQLHSDTLIDAWELENKVVTRTIDTEVAGMPCDREMLLAQIEEVTAIYDRERAVWRERLNGAEYTKRAAIIDWVRAEYNLEISSTKKEVILKHAAEYPLLKELIRATALKSYLDNLHSLEVSSRADGRIHTILKHPTGCGRFASGATSISARFPNMQSIGSKLNPQLKEYNLPPIRASIRAPKGRVFAVVDLAAAHARIASGLANDRAAIEGLNDDSVDNHSKVAAFVAQGQGYDWTDDYIINAKSDKTHEHNKSAKLYRDTAKNTYYGWMNGAGAKRIQQQMTANTGIEPDLDAVRAAVTGCTKIYPGLDDFKRGWLDLVSQNKVKIDGRMFVILQPPGTPGRRLIEADCSRYESGKRIVPENPQWDDWKAPYTKTLGETWQYTEAIAVKTGFIKAWELADEHPEWELVITNVVHDELDPECNTEYAAQAISAVNDVFNDTFQDFLTNGVLSGKDTDWRKLVVDSWADK